MTKTLTKQWREGKLPEGYYYIRWSFNIDDEPSYMIDFYDRENFTNGAFINKQRKFIDEIMSVVPSYDEYKKLEQQLAELQTEENNLLNDIVDLNLTIENRDKKLAIATKALKEIQEYTKEYSLPSYTGMLCHKALKEMEGVK